MFSWALHKLSADHDILESKLNTTSTLLTQRQVEATDLKFGDICSTSGQLNLLLRIFQSDPVTLSV